MSAHERDPLAGSSYRSIQILGAGSMGEVLLAEHSGLCKQVVIKLMRAEHAESPEMRDRFRLEAQALASLDRHPNIVQVLDLGITPEGRPYLVMEHLPGRNLRQECSARGPLSVREAIELCRQLLAGLAEAHAAGILHRDLKPENLFVCAPDRAGLCVLKILDFGIAKILRGTSSPRTPAPLALPTEEGIALGTPRFIAPEQALGRPVDARADLYAVGGVLYWLLAGRDPFHYREGVFAVIQAHITEIPAPPSSLSVRPIPASLDRVVLRALAKRPEDRFATAEELSAELSRVLRALREESAPRWPSTEPMFTGSFQPPIEALTLLVARPFSWTKRLTPARVLRLALLLLLLAMASLLFLFFRGLPLR